MGITICRCCGGTIAKEESAYDRHICKSCEEFIDEALSEAEPQLPSDVAPQPVPVSLDLARHPGE